jgi:mRNA degradation ribonuclease J1/J2
MPIHGEYRMQAAHASWHARPASQERIIIAENGSVVEPRARWARLVDRVDAGVTFVDGLRVSDVKDVARATAAVSPRTAFSSSSPRWPPRTEARSLRRS